MAQSPEFEFRLGYLSCRSACKNLSESVLNYYQIFSCSRERGEPQFKTLEYFLAHVNEGSRLTNKRRLRAHVRARFGLVQMHFAFKCGSGI